MSANICVSCIDVGKGDCILVQAGGKAVLIDTGYEKTSAKVVAYLRAAGVKRLDALVITHYDRDHVGGTRELGRTFAIDEALLPGYVGADKPYRTLTDAVLDLGLRAHPVSQVRSLKMGEAVLTVYPTSLTYVPDAKGNEGNDNDLSLVITLVLGKDSYLFAADLEDEGIDAYLEAAHGTFDVIKMPQHGNKSGNADELLEDVRPQVALITDGADDPADKKILKLLSNAGIDTYRTSVNGTIVVRSDGTGSYDVSLERG